MYLVFYIILTYWVLYMILGILYSVCKTLDIFYNVYTDIETRDVSYILYNVYTDIVI